MNGVLLIAIGDEMYGRMAVTLAASIKFKSNIQIAVIYTAGIFDNVSQRQKELFDILIPIKISDKGINYTAMELKTKLYEYTPFENTLFLDADTIVTPNRSIDWVFESLKEIDFAPFNDGYTDDTTSTLKEKEVSYDPFIKPNDVRKLYFISPKTKLPKVYSGFIWFKKTPIAKRIFEKANEILNDNKKVGLWRGVKPDEVCFNVALARLNYDLHSYPYEPVYLYFKHNERSKEYIYDNFTFISTIGRVQDQRVITVYNDCMEYYFKHFGFRNKFHYEQKIEEDARPIVGFWHICMVNNFEEITKEQLSIIISSGLYDNVEKIYIGCLGEKEKLETVKKIFLGIDKVKISYHKLSVSDFEFPTLKLIEEKAIKKMYCFYIHSKGVFDSRGKHWRDFLNYYNLLKWEDCLKKVKEGFEVVGVKWMEENGVFPRHFSGNFWWTKSEYLKRLPKIDSIDKTIRYNAEFWIGMGNPKIHSFNQKMIDHINTESWL